MRLIFKYLFSLFIVCLLVLWEAGHSYSNRGGRSDMLDTSVEAVSHRLTNELSTLDQTKKADRIIERFLRRWEIAGATVAVVKKGRLVFAKGYGLANRETGQVVEPNNLFRVASVSKLITATAIMKMKETGKLHLNDRVFGEHGILNDSIYQNIRDSRTKKITVEHLLRHTGGFSTRYGDPMFLPLVISRQMKVDPPGDAQTVIRFALSRKLHFTPGTRMCYSNLGYVILGKVIEKVSGMDYEQYVQNSILKPSGVFDMHVGRSLRKNKYLNEVNYYEQSNAQMIPAFDGSGRMVHRSNGGNKIESLGSAGAWVASAAELMKFVVAIDGDDSKPDVLTPESIKYMTHPSPSGLSPIGWMGALSNGTWWRTGTLAGSSALVKHESNGLCWVIVTNTSTWRGSDFPKDMQKMMRRALRSVKSWPDYDLFNYFEPSPGVIASQQLNREIPLS